MSYVVYRHWDKYDNLLYVGCTCNITKRTYEHLTTKDWSQEIHKITLEHFENKELALKAESNYIKKELPKHYLKRSSTKITILYNLIRALENIGYDWKLINMSETYILRGIKLKLIEEGEILNKYNKYCRLIKSDYVESEIIKYKSKLLELKAD